jgi:hypothetical protein
LVQAVDTSDTRFLASPAITEGKIAFVYADDVWVAGTAGKDPRLDRAIETVLEALAKNPPPKAPVRPSFPVRVRAGSDVRSK